MASFEVLRAQVCTANGAVGSRLAVEKGRLRLTFAGSPEREFLYSLARREMTATESAPDSITAPQLARFMPPMATSGLYGHEAGCSNSVETYHGIGNLLGQSREHRANGNVVRRARPRTE